MTDSNTRDELAAKRERNQQQRIEGIKRWVEYIKSEPPETWGTQQNAVVNGQLEAAQSAGTTGAHQQHVEDLAADIIAARDDSNNYS
ncbi:hypothetical protein [Haloarcula salinisoli]|uniref:Uncharacterized protein n=1 Tax=Haloarcula salinisoli TaxID=2487746 RepID=A0A8J7YQW6_9EURY|nr:hypothetical protein [Halomicroarcula salinisoli]MBX0305693.1 hypothetical protein [Halomicroarcula salinisoli]